MQTRVAWESLPNATRRAIEARTGRIEQAHTVSAGKNSALAVVLDTESGRVFVKGIRTEHPGVVTQQREMDINPHVRPVSPAALWHANDIDGWNVIAFEHIAGRSAEFQPGSPDIPLAINVMRSLGSLPCPDVPSMKDAVSRWRSYMDDPTDAAVLHGDDLLHTDYAPDNLLVSDTAAAAHLIDWAWPTRGAGWIDPCVLLVRMMAAGHTAADAEEWVQQVPAWHTAPEGAIATFARAYARMWQNIEDNNPQPWIQAMASAAREWADVRLTRAYT